MPCDVIKTRMDLAPRCAPGAPGLLCSARAFLETGRQLAAAGGGPQALFVGLAPRLLQTVPSTMLYWAAVEGTRRFFQQQFEVEGGEAAATAAAVAPAPAAAAPAAIGKADALLAPALGSSSGGVGGLPGFAAPLPVLAAPRPAPALT